MAFYMFCDMMLIPYHGKTPFMMGTEPAVNLYGVALPANNSCLCLRIILDRPNIRVLPEFTNDLQGGAGY